MYNARLYLIAAYCQVLHNTSPVTPVTPVMPQPTLSPPPPTPSGAPSASSRQAVLRRDCPIEARHMHS
jgi:hypothetical protein